MQLLAEANLRCLAVAGIAVPTTSVTRGRLIHVVGFALSVAFFVTWEPLFGLAAFVLVIFFARWPDEADDAERPLPPPAGPDTDPAPSA